MPALQRTLSYPKAKHKHLSTEVSTFLSIFWKSKRDFEVFNVVEVKAIKLVDENLERLTDSWLFKNHRRVGAHGVSDRKRHWTENFERNFC